VSFADKSALTLPSPPGEGVAQRPFGVDENLREIARLAQIAMQSRQKSVERWGGDYAYERGPDRLKLKPGSEL